MGACLVVSAYVLGECMFAALSVEGTIGCRKKITVCILCMEGTAAVKITPEIPRGQ